MGIELAEGFDCRICGLHHDVLPLSYSTKVPKAALDIPQEEVERRVVITPDQCVIDNNDFYIRGRIPVPIHGMGEPFIWGVWAEISPKNFVRTLDLWTTEGRENEPAFPGWLNTELFLFGNTINLEVAVETQPVGRRPHFRVVDPNHPLARDQREGYSLERAREIAETILHRTEAR